MYYISFELNETKNNLKLKRKKKPNSGEDRRGIADDSSVTSRRTNHHKTRRPQQYEDDYEEYPKKQNTRDDTESEERAHKRPIHDTYTKPEIIPKVRSSSVTASIYNRPRAPPRINRPVPNNEKKKYEYTSQKAAETKSTTALPIDEEIYDDEYDYEGEKLTQPELKPEPVEIKKGVSNPHTNLRVQRPHRTGFKEDKFNNDDVEDEDFDIKSKVTSSKPQRSTSPKIESNLQHQQKSAKTSSESYDTHSSKEKQQSSKPTIDFNKDEYIPDSDLSDYPEEEIDDRSTKIEETHQPQTIPLRSDFRTDSRVSIRQQEQDKISDQKQVHEQQQSQEQTPINQFTQQDRTNEDALQYKTKFHRLSPATSSLPSNLRTNGNDHFQKTNTEPEERDVYTILTKETIPALREPSGFKPVAYNHDQTHDLELDSPKNRPYVRVMKRPFLPSRGGSPYLPRGLKPVGTGITASEYTTENSHSAVNLNPSSISNVHLTYEQNLPITRQNINNPYNIQSPHQTVAQLSSQSSIPTDLRTTTQQPQIESPRSPLDEIFNSDYDVTLNDALNPTLKPLSQSHETAGYLNKYDRSNPYARSDVRTDVSHSSSQYRSTAIPIHSRNSALQTQQPQRQSQSQYYDDDYEY